jgi:hypothetical protein
MSLVRSNPWRRLHERPAAVRWGAKAALLALVVALVLYPRVWLVPSWISRIRDLDALPDTTDPRVAELARVARAQAGPDAGPDALARAVERIVYQQVPYAFDWETWGVMDYVPTPTETLDLGREDCDGRAVLAAAILRQLGRPAHVVTDLKHMWVRMEPPTPGAPPIELMSPGAGFTSIAADEQEGTRWQLDAAALVNLGHALAFGVAVFPLGRELIILGAIVLVLLHPWSSRARRIGGSLLLAGALCCLRAAGATGAGLAERPALVWIGVGLAVAGIVLLAWRRRGSRPPAETPTVERAHSP